MTAMRYSRNRIVFLLLAMLAMIVPSAACTVPVYRFALEEWSPDYFPLTLLQSTELGSEALDNWRLVEQVAKGDGANIVLRQVLADDPDQGARLLAHDQLNASELPLLILHAPEDDADAAPRWSMPLTNVSQAELDRLLDSPARRQLVELLLGGASGVWCFLPSGDAAADQAARATLERQLARSDDELILPREDPLLRIDFPILEVDRSDPAEAFFVADLLGEPVGSTAAAPPIAVPVFGRGRGLAPVPHEEFDGELIIDICAFLLGACSCQVKELNPGHDLLIRADWDAGIDRRLVSEDGLPPLTGVLPTIGSSRQANQVNQANSDDHGLIAPALPPEPATDERAPQQPFEATRDADPNEQVTSDVAGAVADDAQTLEDDSGEGTLALSLLITVGALLFAALATAFAIRARGERS